MLQNQMMKKGAGCLIRVSLALLVPQAQETATQAPKMSPHVTLHTARNGHRAQQRLDGLSAADSSWTEVCFWRSFSPAKNKDKTFNELKTPLLPTSTITDFHTKKKAPIDYEGLKNITWCGQVKCDRLGSRGRRDLGWEFVHCSLCWLKKRTSLWARTLIPVICFK